MKTSTIREKVVEEVNQIPEERLPQILDLIYHFRIGLQFSKGRKDKTADFAGSWKDMPEALYQDFMSEVSRRRKSAFSRRRNLDANIG